MMIYWMIYFFPKVICWECKRKVERFLFHDYMKMCCRCAHRVELKQKK